MLGRKTIRIVAIACMLCGLVCFVWKGAALGEGAQPVIANTTAPTAASEATETPGSTASAEIDTVKEHTVAPTAANTNAETAAPATTHEGIAEATLVPNETELAAAPPVPTEKPSHNAKGMPLVPDFSLDSANGQVKLSDFAGKQVVLYFWTTWCPYCREGMPDKQALHDWMQETEYPGVVLAIDLLDGQQETRASSKAFMTEGGFTLPVLYEEEGYVASMFGISSIPVTVVIDGEGYLKGWSIGPQSLEQTQALLAQEE